MSERNFFLFAEIELNLNTILPLEILHEQRKLQNSSSR